MSPSLPRKTSSTLGALVVLLALVPYLPGPKRFTGLDFRRFLAMLVLRHSMPRPDVAAAPSARPEATEKKSHRSVNTEYLNVPPGSLDSFFGALRRTERGRPGAATRVLHYGDSPTTADSITGDIRTLLQQQFGDAGHGFLLIAAPWAWYRHRGMTLAAHGWRIEPASLGRAPDGIHGLGGVSFKGSAGAYSRVRFPAGHTRVTIYYLVRPGGGDFTVNSGDALLSRIRTEGDAQKPGFADLAIPAGATEIELRVSSGQVRLFGYRFDKPGPGVEYSSLGINGAHVQMVVRFFAVDQWTAALRHEHPDLVIVNYGTNESVFPAYLDKEYPGELRQAIARLRAAVPDASLLVMSPMDRGVIDSSGEIVTPPALEHLIDIQKKVAAETKCAFFNTFEAMGGAGTMGVWYKAQPRLVSADFMHPLPAGAMIVGSLFEKALVGSYRLSGTDLNLVSQK